MIGAVGLPRIAYKWKALILGRFAMARFFRIHHHGSYRPVAERGKRPMDESQIIDGLKTVCQCRGIRKRRFLDHIAAGHTTLDALQRVTGAGFGECGGKRCAPRIEALLADRGKGV